jgi:hypothetical protein
MPIAADWHDGQIIRAFVPSANKRHQVEMNGGRQSSLSRNVRGKRDRLRIAILHRHRGPFCGRH